MFTLKKETAYKEAHRLNRAVFFIPKKKIKLYINEYMLSDTWANCCILEEDQKAWIELSPSYPSYLFFRNILAHELVHLYQFLNPTPGDKKIHGFSFFSWRKKLKDYDIDLKVRY